MRSFFYILFRTCVLSFERDLAFVCFFARARGEVSMNMKRFVYGDDDFSPSISYDSNERCDKSRCSRRAIGR